MDIPEANRTPQAMHHAEQMWAQANTALDRILVHIKGLEPGMYDKVGQSTDASVLFDFMKGYIMTAEWQAEAMGQGRVARDATIVLCACAITRLMRSEDSMQTSTVLAELERDINDDDDHRS